MAEALLKIWQPWKPDLTETSQKRTGQMASRSV